jgi:hypothetical protein
MTAFADLYRLVLPFAKGASDPAMDNALRNAAIEFCQRTRVWQAMATPVSAVAEQSTYDIPAPENAAVVKVLSMSHDKCPVEPKSADELDMLNADWNALTGKPAYFTQMTPGEVILVPMPDTTGVNNVQMRVAYKPTIDAADLPDVLGEHYARDIAHGALAQLLLEPGERYLNPTMAAAYASMFENRIIEVNIQVSKAFSRAPVRVRGNFM